MGDLWPGLLRFLDDPRLALDNNATERALRGVVIGRKNHYGSRSERGTKVAALFYSLIESAKLAGVEPDAFLRSAAPQGIRGERICAASRARRGLTASRASDAPQDGAARGLTSGRQCRRTFGVRSAQSWIANRCLLSSPRQRRVSAMSAGESVQSRASSSSVGSSGNVG